MPHDDQRSRPLKGRVLCAFLLSASTVAAFGIVGLGSAAPASAAVGPFDQPAAGAAWTFTGKTARNTLSTSGITVSIAIANGSNADTEVDDPSQALLGSPAIGDNRYAVDADFAPEVNPASMAIRFGVGGSVRCPLPGGVVAGDVITCADAGRLSITFSAPVVNPYISFAGLGTGSNTNSALTNADLVLTTAGTTLTMLQSSNGVATVDSSSRLTLSTPGATSRCSQAYAITPDAPVAPFTAYAGCGTVRINGVGTQFDFRIDLRTFIVRSSATSASSEFFNITAGASPWIADPPPPTYSLSFSANGGSCVTVPPLSGPASSWVNLDEGSSCTRAGYTFDGWATAPDGSGQRLVGGAPTQLTGDNTLFAVWKPVAIAPSPPAPPSSAPAPDPAPDATAVTAAPVRADVAPGASKTFVPATDVVEPLLAVARRPERSWGTKVVVPGKGTWTVRGSQVSFRALPSFRGQSTIRYRVSGQGAAKASSTMTARAIEVPSVINGGR